MVENGHAVNLGRRGDDQVGNRRPVPAANGKKPLVIDCATKDIAHSPLKIFGLGSVVSFRGGERPAIGIQVAPAIRRDSNCLSPTSPGYGCVTT